MTITEQIEAVEREIRMRERAYPRWVEQGRYTQQKADHELAAMRAVLETLRAVKRIQSTPGAAIARGETHGAIDWRQGLQDIEDALDRVCGQEQQGLF